MFLFTCSATIGFSYPAPSPASGEEFQIFNPSFTRSPRPWRDCCTDAAACSLLYARRPHRSLRNVKAELTGKPAATASLTLIHFKLSVNNSFTLPVECEERAESPFPQRAGPFCPYFLCGIPKRAPDNIFSIVLLSAEGCGRIRKRIPTLRNTISNFSVCHLFI